MKTNEGLLDRVIRVVAGVGILSLLATGPVPGWGLAGVIGVIPLVTGVIGYCPAYTLLGILRSRFARNVLDRNQVDATTR